MGADDRLSVYITGATTAPGLALLRALVARDHYVSGSAATLVEAQRLRAAGALPVYINECDAGDLAGALRLTQAKVLIHAAPLVASSLLPDEQQLTAALDSLGAGTAAPVDRRGSLRRLLHHPLQPRLPLWRHTGRSRQRGCRTGGRGRAF